MSSVSSELLTHLLVALKEARPDLISSGQPDLAGLKRALKPRYGLIWEDQPEHEVDVQERQGLHPLLSLRAEDSLLKNPLAPVHTLIQGDNYHALKVLNYTHSRKVDVIYIDPPYNTGNKDFRYNDRFIEKDDGFRHSKWLSFMSKRLHLAKSLLKDTGVMFISIDENERAALELLCTEELRLQPLGEIIWDKRSQKGGASAISTSHEHILVMANPGFAGFKEVPKPNAIAMHTKAKALVKKIGTLEVSPEVLAELKARLGLKKADIKKKYPEFFYEYPESQAQVDFDRWLRTQAIPDAEAAYNTIETSLEGCVRLCRGTSLAKPDNKGYKYDIPHFISKRPCARPANGWVMPEYTYLEWDLAGRIIYGADESTQPQKKIYLDENMTEKVRSIFVHSKGGVSDLRELNCGLEDKFPYPKPIGLLKHLLGLLPSDVTVLDFFAGSGTTAHAVMQLNAEDEGTRHCILVTNDEGEFYSDVDEAAKRATSWKKSFEQSAKKYRLAFEANAMPDSEIAQELRKLDVAGWKQFAADILLSGGICTHVTRPRLSQVIKGYANAKGVAVPALQQNLLFLETSMYCPKTNERGVYVEYKQFLIEAIDLLRFKEGAPVETKPYHSGDRNKWDESAPWGAYTTLDGSKHLIVLLNENAVETCVEFIATLSGSVVLYPFTYEDDTSAQDLCSDMPNVRVHPVPGNLLKTYRRLNRK